jgi:hypothetical protein
MDTLTVIVMLVLFIFLMFFVFSIALLTPIIGKKNLIFVLSIGFVVGLVGGGFLIAPLYGDIPDIARTIYTWNNGGGTETINVNISTQNNVESFIDDTKQLKGVNSVQSSDILITTTPISSDWVDSLQTRIPESDPGIVSATVIPNDTIILTVQNNSDPTAITNNLGDWINLVDNVTVLTSNVMISINVNSSQVESVSTNLPGNESVVTNITGPVEDKIANLQKTLPDSNTIILICGLIGLFIGLIGLSIDGIYQAWERISKWLRNRKD